MVEAGILELKRGNVRLLRPEELPRDWDAATDPRLRAWEVETGSYQTARRDVDLLKLYVDNSAPNTFPGNRLWKGLQERSSTRRNPPETAASRSFGSAWRRSTKSALSTFCTS